MNRRAWLTGAGLAPILAGLGTIAARRHDPAPAPSTRMQRGTGARRIPDVSLETHDGETVRLYEDLVKGRIVTFNFMYAECEGICPAMTSNLVQVQKALGDRVGREVFMYSITLRPERDSPEVLRRYVEMHGIGPGWRFLTGRPEHVEAVRRGLGFVDPDPAVDADRAQHTGIVLVGNERIDRWSACPALSAPSWIIEVISWMEAPNRTRKQRKPEGAGEERDAFMTARVA